MSLKREQSKRERETNIIHTAEALFCQNGFEATAMNDIAVQAGCTKRTLYQYFVSKEDLFFAVVLQGYERLWETIKQAAVGKTGFEKLQNAYDAFYQFYCESPSLLSLMGMMGLVKSKSETAQLPYQQRFYVSNQAMFEGLCSLFGQGQQDKSIRADIDIQALMYSSVFSLTGFFHMLQQTGQGYLCAAGLEEGEFIKTSLRLFLDSIQA